MVVHQNATDGMVPDTEPQPPSSTTAILSQPDDTPPSTESTAHATTVLQGPAAITMPAVATATSEPMAVADICSSTGSDQAGIMVAHQNAYMIIILSL